MSKKIVSVLLCLALILTAVPSQLFSGMSTQAYALDEDGLPVVEGLTVSGGLWQQSSMIGADIMPEIDEDDEEPWQQGHMEANRWTYNIGSFEYNDWETGKTLPSSYYFLKSDAATTHRLMLWSYDPMDPEKISLSGATLAQPFTRGMIGTEDPERGMCAYYYQAKVTIPAEDGYLEAFYDGISLGKVSIEHRDDIDGCFISEIYVTEKHDDGSYTLEFSGVNMPAVSEAAVGDQQWDSEGNMTDEVLPIWQSASVSGPDDCGVYTAVVTPTGNESESGCWFSFTINGSLAYTYDGGSNYQAQVPNMKAMNESEESSSDVPSVVTPAVVKGETSVTTPSISFTISKGAFTQMRTKLGDGEWSEWAEIQDRSFALTEGAYGLYNVCFEFKNADGESMQIVRNFTYFNDTQAEAPLSVGISDNNPDGHKKLSPENGVYALVADEEYLPTAVCGSADDAIEALEAIVYFGDSTADLASLVDYTTPIPMNRIAGTNIYEAAKPFTAENESYRIGVRVKQGEFDSQPGKITEISAIGQDEPKIYNANTPYFERGSYSYDSGAGRYLIPLGSNITGSFTGTSGTGFAGYMILSYKDVYGSLQEVSGTPVSAGANRYGYYNCSVTIPEDAASLVSVTMRIESVYMQWLYTDSVFMIDSQQPESIIRFSGIPENYEGAYFVLSRYEEEEDGTVSIIPIRFETLKASDTMDMGMLSVGRYQYTISGRAGEICSGSVTVTSGGILEEYVPVRPLSDVSLSFEGLDAFGYYSRSVYYRIYTGEDDSSYEIGGLYPGSGETTVCDVPVYRQDGITPAKIEFYVDPSYGEAELYGSGVDQYGILSYTMKEGENSLTASIRKMRTKTVSGKITNPAGGPASSVEIYISQTVETGWPVRRAGSDTYSREKITILDYAHTDYEGNYTFDKVWADHEAKIEIMNSTYRRGPAYNEISETIAPAVTGKDFRLEYHSYGSIIADLSILYEGADEAVAGDCRLLSAPRFFAGNTELFFSGGDNGVYYLNDACALPGAEITVRFPIGSAGFVEGSKLGLYELNGRNAASSYYYNYIEADVVLDGSGNGRMSILGKELGKISAVAYPDNSPSAEALADMTEEERADALAEATRYEGRMYVYSGYNDTELVGMAKGNGTLTVDGLDDGYYTVVTFYLDTNAETYVQDLAIANDAAALVHRAPNAQSTSECSYKSSVAVSAASVTVSDQRSYAPAGNGLLGGVSFIVHTEPLADYPGWALVKVNLIRRTPEVRIDTIEIENYCDGLSNTFLNAAYVNGEAIPKTYSSGYTFRKTYNNTSVAIQDFEPSIMFFTQVKGSEPVANAKINIKYDTFLRWDYDYSYWWSTSYKATGTQTFSQAVTTSVSMDPFDLEVGSVAVFDELKAGEEDFGVVTAHVYGLPGDEIVIYDGDRKAAEVTLRSIRADVPVKLSNPEYFGIHRLRASRKTADGGLEFTETRTVSLVNRAYTIYMGHVRWIHKNDTRMEDWQFEELSDMGKITFRYWPSKPSAVSFRLYNVKEGQLDNVKFISTYHDTDTEYRCTFVTSGVDEATGRNWCEYVVDPEVRDKNWYYQSGWNWARAVSPSRSSRSYGSVVYPEYREYQTEIASYAGQFNMPLVGLGYFDYFSASYDIVTVVDENASEDESRRAELESYYKATAQSAPDINALASAEVYTADAVEAATAALPSTLRDGLGEGGGTTVTHDQTSDTFSYTMSNGDTTMSYRASTEDTDSFDEDAIIAQMQAELAEEFAEGHDSSYTDPRTGRTGTRTIRWARSETLQGTIYTRQVETDYTQYDAEGNLAEGAEVDIEIQRDFYAPAAVLNALKNGTTVEEEQANIQTAFVQDLMLAASGIMVSDVNRNSSIDDGMSHFSDLGTIHGGLDIYNDIKMAKYGDEARFLGDGFNRGMAVLGAANTAYDIAKGVQGKDPQVLFEALKGLDTTDPKSRQAYTTLVNEIMSHEDIRTSKYLTDSFVNGGTTIAGTADPNVPVKIGLLIGGKTYNTISGWTGEYIDMEFDSILRSIMIELQRQDQRNVQLRIELEKEIYKRIERIAEFENWGNEYYDEETKEWITRKQRIIREVEKELNERMERLLKEKLQRIRINEKFPKLNVYIDPSGYVFEAVPDNRVAGIIATLYENVGGSEYQLWVDDNSNIEERQANPQTTAAPDEDNADAGGRYGWMTPYGTFKILFTDPNGKYQNAETQPITVPPEHTQVNIGLLSTEVPTVSSVEALQDGSVAVNFSKYMQMDSLVVMNDVQTAKIIGNTDRYDASESAVRFYDGDGNLIAGTISFRIPTILMRMTGSTMLSKQTTA